MYAFILRRLGQGVIVTIGVVVAVFILVRFMPGDPARLMAPQAPESALPAIRHELGLDQPIPIQLVAWVSKAAVGDFGDSLYLREPVTEIIAVAFPRTLALVALATAIALVISLPLGILAAVRRDTAFDRGTLVFSVLVHSIPNFWLAILLLFLVSVEWKLLPSVGVGKTGIEYMILPAFVLAFAVVALYTRTTRLTMVSTLDSNYVLAARARGIPWLRVLLRHAFKNSWIPLITMVGSELGYAMSGAAIVELIFNYQGIGYTLIESVLRRDYPMLQGGAISVAVFFILVNLAVDLSYGFIDPRIRKSAEAEA